MQSISAQRLPKQQIRVMFDRARELEQGGRKIIHLEIGRPDFDTPPHIVEATVRALREGKHHYSANAGILELRRAVADKYHHEYGLSYDPGSEIVVTNGVGEGVFLAINALLNPGDQVLIPDPRWVNYAPDAFAALADPVSYTLVEEEGFQPDPEEVASLITPRTRMLLLASPSNPTGGVIGPEVFERLARLAVERDLVVVSDEIYEKIIYAPAIHICAASLEGLRERTIVLNGLSKFYSMTGWRLGFALGPQTLIDPMLRYHQYMITSTNTFAQWGGVTALQEDQGPSLAMVEEFRKRRDYLVDAVDRLPGFSCTKPSGAFYIFPSIAETGLSGEELSRLLLEEAGVATVAGEHFGRRGAGHIRISYANSLQNLKEAVDKIQAVTRTL
ncbi:MAG: pyridoxal phosphate-dependent aminotransferase [Candidatus Aminicenantaceae bacterium]